MPRLTKRFVEGLAASPTDYFEWDEEIPGFGLRVWPSGRKTYVAQYRASGKTRRFKLGVHGLMSPDEARKQARVVLGEVAKGIDPSENRSVERSLLTVSQLCDRYVAAADRGLILGKRGRPKKQSTLYVDKGRIERHIKPLLGPRLVKDITPVEVARFIRDVTSGKTAIIQKTGPRGKAIVEGGPGTAARTVGLLGGILTFAITEGIITTSPTRGVQRPADNRRTRRLAPAEYAALGNALNASLTAKSAWKLSAAVRLLALTGCRRGEIENLQWDEVDLTGRALRLKDSKEGASLRPLSSAAIEVIAEISRDGPYVLPGRTKDVPFGGLSKGWKHISVSARFCGVTPHTLRHSFASTAADLGYSEATIAGLLGHSSGTMTGRYIHHLDGVLLKAADHVASVVAAAMEEVRDQEYTPDGA